MRLVSPAAFVINVLLMVRFLPSNSVYLPLLPDSYTVAFDVTDFGTNSTVFIEEASWFTEQTNITGLHLWKNDFSASLIVRRSKNDYIYHDGRGNCTKQQTPTTWTSVNPLSLPNCFPPTVLTVYDLLKFFNKTSYWNLTKVTSEDVRSLERYSATIELSDSRKTNVSILFFSPWPMQVTKLLRFMQVVVFDTTKPTNPVVTNQSFSFFYYKTHLDYATMEQFFLPPEGVHCEGPNDEAIPLVLLKNFVVSVDVLRNKEKLISEIRFIYSADERIVSFTNMNSSALAFNQGLNLTGNALTVSQDFNHGLQYALDSSTASCGVVQPIPVTSGLLKVIEVPDKNQTILRFKNATEALLKIDLLSYSYVGKRTVDGILLDTWNAKEMVNNTCRAIYEVLFTKDVILEDEKGSEIMVTLPWALRVYNSCDPTAANQRTTYEFYNFVPFSSGFIPWKRFDVSPCLSYTRNDSYLMVLLNVTMDAISGAGIELVENVMRQSLAKVAGVSPLRVSRFMFQPNGSSTMAFFQLANISSVIGTPTEFFEAEKDVLAARRSLNQTLLNDYVITVPREHGRSLTFAIVAGTLADSYKLCHGGGGGSVIVTYTGYSGGSMAGLGISMLMLGSFFGLIVGFYLWKRNRGIAYQMYE